MKKKRKQSQALKLLQIGFLYYLRPTASRRLPVEEPLEDAEGPSGAASAGTSGAVSAGASGAASSVAALAADNMEMVASVSDVLGPITPRRHVVPRPVRRASQRNPTASEITAMIEEESDDDVDYFAEGSDFELEDDEVGDIFQVNRWMTRDAEPTRLHDAEENAIDENRRDDAAVERLLLPSESEFQWTKHFETFQGEKGIFTGQSGPTITTTDPLEIFLSIWDYEIVSKIAVETDRYARQTIETLTLKPHSRQHSWCGTSTNEIYRLLAFFVFQGVHPLTCEKDYYMRKSFAGGINCTPLLSYGRLILLKKFLHFVDNNAVADGEDPSPDKVRLAKLLPIIEHCNAKFQSLYGLHQDISIDESLTLWKGKLSWIQYIKTKRARFGIKSYELCESSSGYLWKFFIYTGKTTTTPETRQMIGAAEDDGATTLIVLKLVQDLYDKGHVLFMDNFYNAPALARLLKRRGIDCIGTLRLNRKNVPGPVSDIRAKSMRKGQVVAMHCGDLAVLAFMDKKKVGMISTYHGVEYSETTAAGKRANKPNVVLDYNRHMGGVDLKDQRLSCFPVERIRNKKWYLKIFRRIFNASLLNAYIIYCNNLKRLPVGDTPRLLTHREFRSQIGEDLFLRFSESVDRDLPQSTPVISTFPISHYIMPHRIPTGSRKTLQRRCRVCTARGKRSQTSYECETCNIPLCVGECFKDFHTLPAHALRRNSGGRSSVITLSGGGRHREETIFSHKLTRHVACTVVRRRKTL